MEDIGWWRDADEGKSSPAGQQADSSWDFSSWEASAAAGARGPQDCSSSPSPSGVARSFDFEVDAGAFELVVGGEADVAVDADLPLTKKARSAFRDLGSAANRRKNGAIWAKFSLRCVARNFAIVLSGMSA